MAHMVKVPILEDTHLQETILKTLWASHRPPLLGLPLQILVHLRQTYLRYLHPRLDTDPAITLFIHSPSVKLF